MKKILFMVALLSLILSSCTTSSIIRTYGPTMGRINQVEQVANAYARSYNYYKEQLPWKSTGNGTDVRYTWNKSTTRRLSWYDTEVINDGRYISVYNTQTGRLVGRMSKYVTDKKTFPVRAYLPYDGVLYNMTLEITTVALGGKPSNVIVRLKQGDKTIESYSMR